MKGISKVKILQLLLGSLLLGILGYNFYVANDLKYEAEGDAASFISLGVSLAKFQKYGHVGYEQGNVVDAFKAKEFPESEISFEGHSTWRPPVWPLLIAGIFLVFGFNLTYVLLFKFFLHLLGILIFYRTLKILDLREIVVIIGSFLYGISPAWQLYSRVFLSEPITLFFITLWFYLLILYIKNKSGLVPHAIVGGILILSHPYYIFLPFSVWLILVLKKQINWKDFLRCSFICATVFSIWIIRNFIALETNQLVVTTSSGAVMAKGWNEDVISEHTNTKGDLADETIVLRDFTFNKEKPRNEVERMELYKDASLHFIRSNPGLILPIIGTKLKSAFNPLPETPRPGILETGRWLFQSVALLALLFVLIFSNNSVITSLAWGLVLSTIGITIIIYSGFRFRMPQVGLEILFIALVFERIIIRKKCMGIKNPRK